MISRSVYVALILLFFLVGCGLVNPFHFKGEADIELSDEKEEEERPLEKEAAKTLQTEESA